MIVKNLKKILFPIFSLFLAYRSIELMKILIGSNPDEFSQIEAIIISFLLTLFITGVFAFIGFAYPSSRLLSYAYYEVKNPKALNSLYKLLGIKYFRALLLFIFWGRKNNRKKYFNGTKRGLNNFIFQTKQSEFGHLGAFIITIISSIILFANGYVFIVIIITFINFIGNLYPIVLQRSHRIRIEKITKYNNI